MKNWFLPVVALILAIISLITIKSVAPSLLSKQALFFSLGAGLFFVLANIPYRQLERYSALAYVLLIVVLTILLVVGKTTRGITAWINLPGGFKFQPSQLAIPIVAIYLLSTIKENFFINFRSLGKLAFLIILPALLIFMQPDLGTGLIYFCSVAVIFFLLPINKRYYLFFTAAVLVTTVIAWNFILKDYQKDRIVVFQRVASFTRLTDKGQGDDAAYNARQSLIAVGSGKVVGRGVGFGVQSHLQFLPERQTDFIFASFAEEWGFIGSVFVVMLYSALILFLLYFAKQLSSIKHQFFLVIVAGMFFLQAMVNIGMNIGILPITGITLPLFSYGGSSIMATLILLAIAQGLIQKNKQKIKLRVR